MKTKLLSTFVLALLMTFSACRKADDPANQIPTKVFVSRVTVTQFPNSSWDALSNADLYIKIGQNGTSFYESGYYTDVPSIGSYPFDIPNVEFNPNSDLTIWFYDYDPTTSDDFMSGISFDVVNDGSGGNSPSFSYGGYAWKLDVTYQY